MLRNEFSQLDSRALWAIPIITLLSMGALLVGIKIRDKLSIQLVKRLVLGMLLVLSLRALWRAFVII